MKKIEQINNLRIFKKENSKNPYIIKAPNNLILEEFSILIEAEKWCEKTKDYLNKKLKKERWRFYDYYKERIKIEKLISKDLYKCTPLNKKGEELKVFIQSNKKYLSKACEKLYKIIDCFN